MKKSKADKKRDMAIKNDRNTVRYQAEIARYQLMLKLETESPDRANHSLFEMGIILIAESIEDKPATVNLSGNALKRNQMLSSLVAAEEVQKRLGIHLSQLK